MKRKFTFKCITTAAVFMLGTTFVVFAQSANTSAESPADLGKKYELSFDQVLFSELNTIQISGGEVVGTPTKSGGRWIVYVVVGEEYPMEHGFTVSVNNDPPRHVTVADILGNTDEGTNDNPVFLARPLNPTNTSGNAEGGHSTSISQPTPTTPNVAVAQTPIHKIEVFPNPASDNLNIVTEGEVLWGIVEVIDITGKRVMAVNTGLNAPAANGPDKLSVSVSNMIPGTYILRFKTNKETYTKRFQVVR